MTYVLGRQLDNGWDCVSYGDGVRRHFKHLNVVVSIPEHGELVQRKSSVFSQELNAAVFGGPGVVDR